MSCSLDIETRRALRVKIGGDLLNKIKSSTPLDIENYIKEIYDLFKKASQDEALAIDAARLVPTLILQLINTDIEMKMGMRKLDKTLGIKLYEIEIRYEDIAEVQKDLGLNKSKELTADHRRLIRIAVSAAFHEADPTKPFNFIEFVKNMYEEAKTNLNDDFLAFCIARIMPILAIQVLSSDAAKEPLADGKSLKDKMYNLGITIGNLELLEIRYDDIAEVQKDLGFKVIPKKMVKDREENDGIQILENPKLASILKIIRDNQNPIKNETKPESQSLIHQAVQNILKSEYYKVINNRENEVLFLRRKIFSDMHLILNNPYFEKRFNLNNYFTNIYHLVYKATKSQTAALNAIKNIPDIILEFVKHSKAKQNLLQKIKITTEQLLSIRNNLYNEKESVPVINTIKTDISIKQNVTKNISKPNKEVCFLVFDTETNGKAKNFNAPVTNLDNWPRIAQLGWQLYDQKQNLLNEGSVLIQPDGWVIPKEKFFIDNNMSTERCQEFGIPISQALDKLLFDVTKADYLIAHNMNFDINVLGAELIRAKKEMPKKIAQVCTMESSTNYCKIAGPYGYKWPTLTELHTKLFSKGFEGAHDALDDVKACAKSFFELVKRNVIVLK